MRPWLLAWRLLQRDWRGGELYLLAAALVLTVSAITAVGLFADRIEQVLRREGSELIAADLMLESTRPLPAQFGAEARSRGLQTAELVELRTVVMGQQPQLVVLKAVDPSYPLRGSLRFRPEMAAPEQIATAIPSPGTVWTDAYLLRALGLQIGDRLGLGEGRFNIAALLTHEPDEGRNPFAFAPRVLMNRADLAATGLMGPASRASHRLLVAGEAEAVMAYRDWVRPRLGPNISMTEALKAQNEFSLAFERAARFLHLASLSTLLVAGAAIALASQRLVQRQIDAMALMRCLGAPRHLLLWALTGRLLLLGLLASLVGGLFGWLGQLALGAVLADWFKAELPAPSPWPLTVGAATGFVSLLGFGLPPLIQLARVPPLRALKHELGTPQAPVALMIGTASLSLALLVLWQAGDLRLGLRVLLGVALALLALILGALALLALLKPLVYRARGIWRLGLANLSRRPGLALTQTLGLGLGILALLLLTLVRSDLIESWRMSLPEGTPNYFLLNIQPHEVAPLRALLQEAGIQTSGIHPMLGGRLLRINERAVIPSAYPDPRARQLASREFNLSYAVVPQSDNRIIAGQWWSNDQAPPQFSVEEGIAKTLGIKLGDTLTFWVSGHEVSAPVTSLRAVRWDSFNVNFFVVASPALLRDETATFITSLYLPSGQQGLLPELARRFPGVLALDVESILSQVRGVIERAAQAIELIFGFTCAAGLLLLYAGIYINLDQRRAEHATLRALGTSQGALLLGLGAELTVQGLLAALLAASFAQSIGWYLATEVFELRLSLDPIRWALGVIGPALAIGLAGTLAAYPLLRSPPWRLLDTAGTP